MTAKRIPEPRESISEFVTRTRAEQGLPPTVEDPTTIQRALDLFRSAREDATHNAPR